MDNYAGFTDYADMLKEFGLDECNVKDENILFASYEQGSYDGDAFILIYYEGKLWVVTASHCSCYGLEGQWELDEMNLEALKKHKFHESEHKELQEFLTVFFKNAE